MSGQTCRNCGTPLGLDDQDVGDFCSIGCKTYKENVFYFSTSKKALKFCRIAIELGQAVNVTMEGALFAVLALPEDLQEHYDADF